MAGIVVALATLVSCLIMAIVQSELLTARLVRERVGVGAEAAVEVAVAPLARAVLGRADDAFEGEPGLFQCALLCGVLRVRGGLDSLHCRVLKQVGAEHRLRASRCPGRATPAAARCRSP